LNVPIRRINAMALSPDGRTLAASSNLSNDILLWDLDAGQARLTLRGHASPVISIDFSGDGLLLASGGLRDRTIIVWDPAA
jgi:WD40 repeat protein